ncbi:pilin [Corallococcus aberystwythensis]|uniref:Pilin n=2 Tax=Corallococcus aberystwythensis TaxID=2316722 RepID=A0A3A8R111_9BACT|nr:pilin [Corallococcus aberystwythensis]
MFPESAAPKKTALPGVALGFAIAGMCLACLWPVGVVLAILAMVKTSKPEYAGRRGLAVASLIAAGVGPFVIGIWAAIAIPNFIRFQARSKQTECRVNLKAIFTAAKARMVEGEPMGSFEALGFQPEPRNRYAYVLVMPDSVIPVGAPFPALDPDVLQAALDRAGVEPGVQGECPDCTLTAACVGNVDNDDTLDVWSISTADRTDASNQPVAAGAPLHHVNDVQE